MPSELSRKITKIIQAADKLVTDIIKNGYSITKAINDLKTKGKEDKEK